MTKELSFSTKNPPFSGLFGGLYTSVLTPNLRLEDYIRFKFSCQKSVEVRGIEPPQPDFAG